MYYHECDFCRIRIKKGEEYHELTILTKAYNQDGTYEIMHVGSENMEKDICQKCYKKLTVGVHN